MKVTIPTSARALELITRWARDRRLDLRSDPVAGSGAVFSRCGRYRYLLWHRPLKGVPFMGFAMLHPSFDDRAVGRCRDWAKRAGYSGPLVWNLFALCAIRPAALKADRLPVGLYNDSAIDLALQVSGPTVAAWGAHGSHLRRDATALRLCAGGAADLHVLKLTKSGQPAHPLSLPSSIEPRSWKPPL